MNLSLFSFINFYISEILLCHSESFADNVNEDNLDSANVFVADGTTIVSVLVLTYVWPIECINSLKYFEEM